MAKITYNIILFTDDLQSGNKGFVKYRDVGDIEKFRLFVNKKFPKWKFATVYNHKTKEKIEVIKP